MSIKPRIRPSRLQVRGTGYTNFVKGARLALPFLALVIVGFVTAKLSFDPQNTTITQLPEEQKTQAGQIDLVDAKYEGTDKRGRAYTLAAEHAKRDTDNPNIALLTHPKADILLSPDQWLAVHAKNGAFDTGSQTLKLFNDVIFYHDSGYEMHLDNMSVDIIGEHVETNSTVQVQGPGAKMSATGLEIIEHGDVIKFKGPATLTLRLDQLKEG